MSKCPKCQHQNPPDTQSCLFCGVELTGEPSEHDTQIYKAEDLASEMDLEKEEILKGTGPRLVALEGDKSGSRFGLTKPETTLGRHSSSDIFLDDVTVSRHHAEIQKEESRCMLQDKGSLNGTYLNRQRIESVELNSGDEIQIGKYKFLYLDKDI